MPQGAHLIHAADMRRLLYGHLLSRALCTAAELRIADVLADGPRSVDDLAAATNTNTPALRRLLRALAAFEVFVEHADARFGLTPLAETLRDGVPGSARPTALLLSREFGDAWNDLHHTVLTGQPAFDRLHGMSLYEYTETKPETGDVLERSQTEGITMVLHELIGAIDAGRYRAIVDVGGGYGELLAALLERHPDKHGVLFDLPRVVEAARPRFAVDGLSDRSELVGGDFFTAVPSGGDLYVLRYILHNWEDDRCVDILRACRRAMSDRATLAVVEYILPQRATFNVRMQAAAIMDLYMMAVLGGRERTVHEYVQLFEAAGFTLTSVSPMASGMALLRAKPQLTPALRGR